MLPSNVNRSIVSLAISCVFSRRRRQLASRCARKSAPAVNLDRVIGSREGDDADAAEDDEIQMVSQNEDNNDGEDVDDDGNEYEKVDVDVDDVVDDDDDAVVVLLFCRLLQQTCAFYQAHFLALLFVVLNCASPSQI